MKPVSVATLGVALAVYVPLELVACYVAGDYPSASSSSSSSSQPPPVGPCSSATGDAGCDASMPPPPTCLPEGACEAMSTACQPYTCNLGTCEKASPASVHTSCTVSGQQGHCDGMGTCVSCTDGVKDGDEQGIDCGGSCPLACDGTQCTTDDTCKSGRCAGTCLKSADSACQDDAECATSRCNTGMCATCAAVGDCKSAQCDMSVGACKAPPGAPCGADLDCANGTCDPTTKLCQKVYQKACATWQDCTTGFCFNGTCSLCAAPGDCVSHECVIPTGALAGTCTLPPNSYCSTASSTCASGLTCSGSPAKCQ